MARGDVIFYRPAGVNALEDLDPENFEDFRVLAAYAQTYPYGPDAFRPWHHVAISISDGDDEVIGFVPSEYEPGQARAGGEAPLLQVVDGGPSDGEARDMLRPPDGIVNALVANAQLMRGAPYSAAGLLPFAAITAAWMLPEGNLGGQKLRTIAFGASAVARASEANAESCTTAVARAVRKALGRELALEEPPPVAEGESPARELRDDPRVRAVLEFIMRFDNSLRPYFEEAFVSRRAGELTRLRDRGTLRVGFPEFFEARRNERGPEVRVASFADHLSLIGPDAIVGWADVDHALNVMALREAALFRRRPGDDYYPGGDLPFGAYLCRVRTGLEIYDEDTDFEARGIDRRDDPITSDDFLISPAMLWEALLEAAFVQVEND